MISLPQHPLFLLPRAEDQEPFNGRSQQVRVSTSDQPFEPERAEPEPQQAQRPMQQVSPVPIEFNNEFSNEFNNQILDDLPTPQIPTPESASSSHMLLFSSTYTTQDLDVVYVPIKKTELSPLEEGVSYAPALSFYQDVFVPMSREDVRRRIQELEALEAGQQTGQGHESDNDQARDISCYMTF